MAGRIFRVHFEFGDPYVFHDLITDLLLLWSPRRWVRVSIQRVSGCD